MDLRLTRNIILYLLLAGIMVFVNVSCKVTKINAPKDETIRKAVRTNQVFQSAFTGFVLYDPLRQSSLIEINSNKPFIPASNTKIVTLLNTLETLGDSLPIISYLQSNDTVYFRGTANPLNLNPNFQDNGHWLQWCDDMRDKTLVYVREYPTPKKFGPGWAWDDYLYNYQLENSPFPIYGNQLIVKGPFDGPKIYPGYFRSTIHLKLDTINEVTRDFESNAFDISVDKTQDSVDLVLPIHITDTLLKDLMEEAIDQPVLFGNPPQSINCWKVRNISFPDSLYIELMHESDNFIAEQLLLASAKNISDTMIREIAIREATGRWEPFLRDTMRWVDGSGLSRYNLFTPYSIVQVLERIYELRSMDWIRKVFPTGGENGTISAWYEPFIYAKTGTLSNNHNLSGFIETKSGRVLIFSFMHNHYFGSSTKYKIEMEKILKEIHALY